ncbi:uncharacterized protein LOC136038035 isoform X2 [Artemia franciscana]|uniref:Uncharacterized protein n=1 Tax=Artemia franciscana TaxID=6661 RepID=A0AA88HV50_ARTSF|nr:hypothetical protein QYM36_005843 [Artemia franciscana]
MTGLRKRIRKVQAAKWPTSRKLKPVGSTSQISFNKSSRRGRDDSARSETLRTVYQSIKSNNTQLAQSYQNECLKSANLAEELVVLNQQLMDSVTECSILKAQISKWEQLKKATQKRTDDMENKARNFYQTMQLRFSEMESMYLDLTEEIKSVKDILGEEIVASSKTRSPRNSELYPAKQQNHQKTPKVQKIRPSIGEFRLRDPVIQLQRIENAPLTAESVSSPSDGEESGDMTFENVSLAEFARRQARRRSTMFVPRRLPKRRIVSLSPDQNNRTIPESSPTGTPGKLPESKVILKKLSIAEIEQFTPQKLKLHEKNGSSPESPNVLLKRTRNQKLSPGEIDKLTSQKFKLQEKTESSSQKLTSPKVFLRRVSVQEIEKADSPFKKPKLPNGKDESPIKKNKIGYSLRKSIDAMENIVDIEVVEVAQPTDPQFDTVLEEVENIAETLSEPISSLPMQDEVSEGTLILEDNISNRLNSTYTVDVPLTDETAESNNVDSVAETNNLVIVSEGDCNSWGDLVARPNHLPVTDPLEGTSSLYIRRKSRGRKYQPTSINDPSKKFSKKIKSADEKGRNSKDLATRRTSSRQKKMPKRFLLANDERCQMLSLDNQTGNLATEVKNSYVQKTEITSNDIAEDCPTEDSAVEKTVFAAPTIIDDTLFGSPNLSRNPGRRRAMSETIVSVQEIEIIVPPRRTKSRMSYKEAKLNSLS